MTIAYGQLDSLLGLSLNTSEVGNISYQSSTFVNSFLGEPLLVSSLTANIVGPTNTGVSYKITSVNDSLNTITLNTSVQGAGSIPQTYYVVGVNSDSILLSGSRPTAFAEAVAYSPTSLVGTTLAVSYNGTTITNNPLGTNTTWTAPAEPPITAAQAANATIATILPAATIQDSAANVVANLDAINLILDLVGAIKFTDSGTVLLNLSDTQIIEDGNVFQVITTPFTIHDTDAPANELSYIFAEKVYPYNYVSTVTVADTSRNILANLDTIQQYEAEGKVTGIVFTDDANSTSNFTLSTSQFSADAAALNAISSNYTVTVQAGSSSASIAGLTNHATTVEFSGDVSQYTLTTANGTVTVSGNGVTDHVTNVAAIQFADTTAIVAATPGPANAVTTGNVTELYSAVLAREPDVGGLTFYQNFLKANPSTPLLTFAEYFLNSPEYTSAHNYAQSTAGDEQFITDSYQNLLHRTPSTTEVSFYETNVLAPAVANLTPGTAAYASAALQAHALMLVYFSASAEFLTDVQVTATNPASAQHWLVLT